MEGIRLLELQEVKGHMADSDPKWYEDDGTMGRARESGFEVGALF